MCMYVLCSILEGSVSHVFEETLHFYFELDLVEMTSPPNHFGRKHATLYGADGCALGDWLAALCQQSKTPEIKLCMRFNPSMDTKR